MKCDVTNCPSNASVLVHFANVKTPYAYCHSHAYRRGKPIWRKGVRHIQGSRA